MACSTHYGHLRQHSETAPQEIPDPAGGTGVQCLVTSTLIVTPSVDNTNASRGRAWRYMALPLRNLAKARFLSQPETLVPMKAAGKNMGMNRTSFGIRG